MNDLLEAPYVKGGRTSEGLDCWGLALLVRERLGLPALADDPLAVTGNGPEIAGQFAAVSSGLEVGEPVIGALAAVFKKSLFVHVGVVVGADGRLWVLEANPGACPSMRRVEDFNAAHYKVIYYADRNLPK